MDWLLKMEVSSGGPLIEVGYPSVRCGEVNGGVRRGAVMGEECRQGGKLWVLHDAE